MSIYDFVIHMTFCVWIFQLKLLYFHTYHYYGIMMILDVFFMDGFFCCKGWLKLNISSFFKTPKLFLLCFQILSIFIQAPMVPSHTQDSPWGLLCEPPAGRRLSLQDGEGASRRCSNPDWSARHAASSIVPLQALMEALQSESVLLPVGKPVRVCLVNICVKASSNWSSSIH